MRGAGNRARLRAAALAAAAATLAGCAARLPARPGGTSSPAADAASIFAAAGAHCTGLRTLTAELRLSGRAGGEPLRGRVIAGLEAGGNARLEGVAPFGPAIFVLAARAGEATLFLPRDRRVLTETTVSAVLERLTGLALDADELLRALTGCVGAGGQTQDVRDPRQWPGDWRAVGIGPDIEVFLRRQAGAWRIVAADAGAWRADYADVEGYYPRTVRLRSADGQVDLTAGVSQLEVNTRIDPAAFEVAVPPDTDPLTLDELRTVAPLRTP